MRLLLLLGVIVSGCSSRPLTITSDAAELQKPPTRLRDTGLYADWSARTLNPAVYPYTPGFTLWSDEAQKSRWIFLPAGSRIDVTDPNAWVFPVGTRLWKEFRHDLKQADGSVKADQHVETRMLWKRGEGDWQMVTYVWSADQTEATLADDQHVPPVPFPGTDTYEVPVQRCPICHGGRPDKVLGFEALLLAAPEADQEGLTWQKLVNGGLVMTREGDMPTNDSLQFLTQARPIDRKAAGYLHVNCGLACHHPGAGVSTPYSARIEISPFGAPSRIEDTDLFHTAIGVRASYTPSIGGGPWYRIRPLDVAHSALYYRASIRNGLTGGGEQMPPIVTHEVDQVGLTLLSDWINSMNGAPYTTAGVTASQH